MTGSNPIAGLTVLAVAGPGLIGPLAGVLVDRLPRAVMIGLNLANAGLVSTLWLVQDRRQLWLLFAVAARSEPGCPPSRWPAQPCSSGAHPTP